MEKQNWLNDLKSAIEHYQTQMDELQNQYTSTMKSNGKLFNMINHREK